MSPLLVVEDVLIGPIIVFLLLRFLLCTQVMAHTLLELLVEIMWVLPAALQLMQFGTLLLFPLFLSSFFDDSHVELKMFFLPVTLL